MTGIDEYWSFSYIIDMNRLKNVYDVDFALSNGYIHSVDEEPDWERCGAARFMWGNPHEVVMDSVTWDRCGINLKFNGIFHYWEFDQQIIGFKFENGQIKTFKRSDYGSANDYVDAVTGFLQRWEENGYELDESVIIQDDEKDFVV